MYCEKGMHECNGCGFCQSEVCDICKEREGVAYYGGVAYCRACEIKDKKRSNK